MCAYGATIGKLDVFSRQYASPILVPAHSVIQLGNLRRTSIASTAVSLTEDRQTGGRSAPFLQAEVTRFVRTLDALVNDIGTIPQFVTHANVESNAITDGRRNVRLIDFAWVDPCRSGNVFASRQCVFTRNASAPVAGISASMNEGLRLATRESGLSVGEGDSANLV